MADINLTHADLNAILEGGSVNEEVLQQIIDVSRVPLEFSDRLGTSSSGNKRFDWLMDRLAAAVTTNAAVDGADTPGNDALQGQRVGNEMQILIKKVRISILGEAANSIASIGKMARQVNRRGQELMRDWEKTLLGNFGAVVDDGDTVAGRTATLEAWLDGNILIPGETGNQNNFTLTEARVELDPDGVGGGGWENNTAGLVPAWVYSTNVPVAITEDSINTVMEALFVNTGSRANRVGMSDPALHSRISAYYFTSSARIATLTAETNQKGPATAVGAVNAILTDYGIIDLVPNSLQGTADTANSSPDSYTFYILDFSMLEQAKLTGFRVESLAKDGLGENRLLSMTAGFKPLSTEAQGIIVSADAAVAMTA